MTITLFLLGIMGFFHRYRVLKRPLSRIASQRATGRLHLLLLHVLSCSVAASAKAPTFDELYRDRRSVVHVLSFDFGSILPQQTWVVAEILPQNQLGWIPGQYGDGATGKIYTPPNVKMVLVAHGSFKIAAVLQGQVPNFADYKWDAPIPPFGYRYTPPPGYFRYTWERTEEVRKNAELSVFLGRTPKTLILQFHETAKGAAKFGPPYIIPSVWSEFALPALNYFQANPQLFRPELAAANRAALEKLLSDENPFIAIAAARVLGQVRALDVDFVRGPLAQAKSFRQAAFLLLLFRQALPERRNVLIEEVIKVVDSAKNADDLQGLALGASMLPSRSTDQERNEYLQILKRIDIKQAAFNTQTAADEYIVEILRRRELRGQPQQPTQSTTSK